MSVLKPAFIYFVFKYLCTVLNTHKVIKLKCCNYIIARRNHNYTSEAKKRHTVMAALAVTIVIDKNIMYPNPFLIDLASL